MVSDNSMISKRWFQKNILGQWQLYLLCLPGLVYLFLFCYLPMAGIQIAFKDYTFASGIYNSGWVGLKHFTRFMESYNFRLLIWNTVAINLYGLIVFPIPVLMALVLNSLEYPRFKKLVQTVTYAPHFISVIVLCGMVILFTSPTSGVINTFIKNIGGEPIHFMANPVMFRHIYVWSGVWQNTGWDAIIYLAALASIPVDQYEAAKVDGASRLQIVNHIEIPSILPTVIIMLLLRLGNIMNVGFTKVYLLQNSANEVTSEIIATYVYKVGLVKAQMSFSTAVGLFNTMINIAILCLSNCLSKKTTETSLW